MIGTIVITVVVNKVPIKQSQEDFVTSMVFGDAWADVQEATRRAGRRRALNQLAASVVSPEVQQILAFGSYARGQEHYSSDYDLILVVSPEMAERWLDRVCRDEWGLPFSADHYIGMSYARFTAAMDLLDLVPQSDWQFKLDIFLFPPDWRDEHQLEYLQVAGRHDDPQFMRNIARDAIEFDSAISSFRWRN